MVYSKRFPSGLRLVVKQMDGLLSVSMGVLVGTGSCFESEKENGISHFIEHMMFKGTQKRTAFEISDAMDRIGAQVNAFTSKDITCYYAKSTFDHAEDAFEVLSDFVLHSVFPEEEMAREKGVVLEEIAMTEDTPDDLCLDVLAEAYFGKEGYGRSILGPAANVRGFTRQDLFDYIAERYCPENMVVSFAGNISIARAEDLVARYMEEALVRRAFSPRQKHIELKADSLFRKKDIEQVHIAFAWPSLAREDERLDAASVVNIILGGGMSSRLFQRVRERLGLAYTVYSYLSSLRKGGCSPCMRASTPPTSAGRRRRSCRRCAPCAKKSSPKTSSCAAKSRSSLPSSSRRKIPPPRWSPTASTCSITAASSTSKGGWSTSPL